MLLAFSLRSCRCCGICPGATVDWSREPEGSGLRAFTKAEISYPTFGGTARARLASCIAEVRRGLTGHRPIASIAGTRSIWSRRAAANMPRDACPARNADLLPNRGVDGEPFERGSFARRATGPTNGRGGRGRGIMSKQNRGAAVLAGVALLGMERDRQCGRFHRSDRAEADDWTGQLITTRLMGEAQGRRQQFEYVQADYLDNSRGWNRVTSHVAMEIWQTTGKDALHVSGHRQHRRSRRDRDGGQGGRRYPAYMRGSVRACRTGKR